MSSEENNLVAEAHSQEVGKLQKKMGELEKALEGARVQVTQREVELKAERSKTETANVNPPQLPVLGCMEFLITVPHMTSLLTVA